MFVLVALLVLIVVVEILLHVPVDIYNFYFTVQRSSIKLQWRNNKTLKCSQIMQYDHRFWDVQRISNSPPIETYETACSKDNDVTRLHTPPQEPGDSTHTSFIRTASHMIDMAFKKRHVDSMQIGIIKSVREARNTDLGNQLANAICYVSKSDTSHQICEKLKECLENPTNSSPIATLNFLKSDMIFNSWRNAENFSNQTNSTQLAKGRDSCYKCVDKAEIDYSKPHLYIVLSRDHTGWYIVEHTSINTILQHVYPIHVHIAMLVTFITVMYLMLNRHAGQKSAELDSVSSRGSVQRRITTFNE